MHLFGLLLIFKFNILLFVIVTFVVNCKKLLSINVVDIFCKFFPDKSKVKKRKITDWFTDMIADDVPGKSFIW